MLCSLDLIGGALEGNNSCVVEKSHRRAQVCLPSILRLCSRQLGGLPELGPADWKPGTEVEQAQAVVEWAWAVADLAWGQMLGSWKADWGMKALTASSHNTCTHLTLCQRGICTHKYSLIKLYLDFYRHLVCLCATGGFENATISAGW